MTFLYLKRSCPICGGERRDCRENSETQVIHCRSGNEAPEGFSFLGLDGIGFGMYAKGEQKLLC